MLADILSAKAGSKSQCRRRRTREVLHQFGRPLDPGEEDGHLLPFAFEGAAGGEDLLGQVLRRVSARLRWWWRVRGLSDALSAIPAELFSRLVLRFAGCADEREISAARGAEPSAGSILPATL
jgi:hypothetical protein